MKLEAKFPFVFSVFLVAMAGFSTLEPAFGDDSGRPPRPDGERGDRDRGRSSSWERLPEEKRQRIREALKQVFESEEVRAARGKMMEATEDYKSALRDAIGQVDSELKADIEKMLRAKLESDFGGRSGRFRGGMVPLDRVPEEKREQMKGLVQRFGDLPEVRELRRRFMGGMGGGGKDRGEEFTKMRKRELGMFRKFVQEEAPDLLEFVPEKPPVGPMGGREGERRRPSEPDRQP